MKTGQNIRFANRITGQVDSRTIELAKAKGIDCIAGGSISKKDGRVRVSLAIRTDVFPGSHKNGGCLRSRLVWWLNTGEVIKGNGPIDIHHKDTNRTNDRFDNLEKIDHFLHGKMHNADRKTEYIECKCENCGNPFQKKKYRITYNPRSGRFCSQICYHEFPRSEEHNLAISKGMEIAHATGRRSI
jgi:hypothetical protein